jgi:hypothetical protein
MSADSPLLPDLVLKLEAGRLLLYRQLPLLVNSVTDSTAQALDANQHLYQLLLTPLGWAVDVYPQRLTISYARELHEALEGGDWPEILFYHQQNPFIPLTAADQDTSAGAIYQLFRQAEQRVRTGGREVGPLLAEVASYGNRDIMLYLLRNYTASLPSLLLAVDWAAQYDRLDLLSVLLDWVEEQRPADRYAINTRAAKAAGHHNKASMAEWLVQRSRETQPDNQQSQSDRDVLLYSFLEAARANHWGLALELVDQYGFPPSSLGTILAELHDAPVNTLAGVVDLLAPTDRTGVYHALDEYLQYATDRDRLVVDRLVSYLPPGFRVPQAKVEEWRQRLTHRGQLGLVLSAMFRYNDIGRW